MYLVTKKGYKSSIWYFVVITVLIASKIQQSNSQNCLYKLITVNVCEKANVSLSCAPNKIKILSTNYGRLDNQTCRTECPTLMGTACPNSYFATTSCSSNATGYTNTRCNGYTNCSFAVSNSVVGFDPCNGRYKYLTINYLCI